MPAKQTIGKPGDGIEVSCPGSDQARRGQIIDVLGGSGHEHYLVRWTDGHESIHYPSDGTLIVAAMFEELDVTGFGTAGDR